MFFHEDLELYKNNNFRSYYYLDNIWRIIEFDLIYITGMINNGNITINIESDILQMTATSSFKNIFNKTYDVNFNHSLLICYDFMCDITLNLIDTFKNFYFEVLNCNFYYDKKHKSDEGFIECSISSNLKIKDLNKFKTSLFCVLAKELQFVVNKNILHLDIEKKDAIQADIDSLYEYVMTTCILKKVSFSDVLKTLNASHKDKELLIQLRNQINKT
tara:strand:- start:11 stop:661 length:651 start_codon:yes stop_codon:yes gene_type:complete